jgi:hypothetical protein
MELFGTIAEAVKQIPGGGLVAGVTAAVTLLLAYVLLIVNRAARTRRTRLWQIAAITGVPVATTLDLLAVHAARVTMLSGFASADASERSSVISAGISGQLNGIALLASSSVWIWPLGLFVLHKMLETRRPADSPRFAGPLFLIPIGLVAIVVGSMLWATGLVHGFASIAWTDPETKTARILGALDEGASALRRFAQVSRWTILGLTALAVALIAAGQRRPRPTGEPLPAGPGRAATWWASALALLLAAALWVGARPLRAENQLPWPAPQLSGEVLAIATPPTPDLAGPDPIVRAPVIQLMADRLAMDTAPYSLEDLGGPLQTLRTNYQLLHPGERFAGDLITMPRLVSLLWVAHHAGYDALMFIFSKEETTVRPTLGTIRRVLSSAARASLMDASDREANGGADPEGDHTVLRLSDFKSYEPFARRLVELRRAGRDVVLDLGKEPGGATDSGRP